MGLNHRQIVSWATDRSGKILTHQKVRPATLPTLWMHVKMSTEMLECRR